MEEKLMKQIHGGAIMGRDFLEAFGHLGGICEASERHLGSIWEAYTVGFPPEPKHHKSHNT